MKCFALALLLSSFAIAKDPLPQACGPQTSFKINRSPALPLTPVPEDGKALVYILGTGKYSIDGKPLGEVQRSYSFFQLDPGERHMCAQFTWITHNNVVSLHSLNPKAGETYYLELRFLGRGPFEVGFPDPDEARYRISKLPFTTSQPK
jgi:hypothetical protein